MLLACLISSRASNELVQENPEKRAQQMLSQMTLDEKVAMVHGSAGPYAGNVPRNDRLGIPPLHLEDGPQGVADGVKLCTCWPSALTVVSSWDVELNYAFGKAMAIEQWLKGTNVLLGPMVNIARVPMGGRNFESYGEDPYLSSVMVAQSVLGIQSQGVIATAKHYADNNQEFNRSSTSANVDERTQWEIYYPAFQAAVNAGVGSIMCSYNRINNTYACENHQTLGIDLKTRMNFKGFVMSDWGATHSTVDSANNGLDMEMPSSDFFGEKLKLAIREGKVSSERLDDMVLRILIPMFSLGMFEYQQTGSLDVDVRLPEHAILARHLAAAGTVLLKNKNNILPLDTSKLKRIAVIGNDGDKDPVIAGGGSGHVIASYVITPLQGIRNRAGPSINVSYAATEPMEIAAQMAASADVAIVFVATTSSEGEDRRDLYLGGGQDELISKVVSVQPNTIVVVHTPGAVLMPWESSVPAIICGFLPGQEDGNAIADVLFGDVNPSGKLPVTFSIAEEQIPVNTIPQYPGIDNEASYSEGLLVGYRWYDAKRVAPLFPFGHGLSYTDFHYDKIQISSSNESVEISADVQNIGQVFGAEVVQLYIGYPLTAGEPPKVLRGFQKIFLQPKSVQTVNFSLGKKELSVWDVSIHNWRVSTGEFRVYLGSSSADLRLTGSFTI